ncbi:hypothetical protein [Salirhabdus salicampi]|uniref:hypothetical protein n=1 Tax=Salirhabdus salicampi TaxID=476102 RepID=UPI0020C4F9AA|nr:hypothetical protein [Salirhabdus salicampi]MCP8615717.1 hypothetical protein [Salirhabdus salicampi]
MKEVITLTAELVNVTHDILLDIFGVSMTDKQLHFWIVGIIGMITFFLVYFSFKLIHKLKWSLTILAFIYTFTVMVVFVFAIEIQQAVTNRGNMEFADAMIGLWGFIVFFFFYAVIVLSIMLVTYLVKKKRTKKIQRFTSRTRVKH